MVILSPKIKTFNFKLCFILVLFLFCLVSIQSTNVRNNDNDIPKFVINLDLPPQERFVEVTKNFKDYTIKVIKLYLGYIPKIVQIIFKGISKLFWMIKPEYYKELEGMSQVLGVVDAKELLLLQYAYEFSAFCTSVIAYDSEGSIIHSRNLDFAFAPSMRNITYEANFVKDGKNLYKGIMFVGLNGVFTGQRDGYSVSLNERKPSWRKNPLDLLWNIGNTFVGLPQVSHVIRDTFQECNTYSCALNRLTTSHQIAPSYYAISGNQPYEGTIITRDRYGVAHVEILNEDQWYIVQTNDDHWTGICTIRCSYVKISLDTLGRENVTGEKLVDILSQWPSNNMHSIYNVLMLNEKKMFDAKLIENDKPAPI